MPLLPYVNRLEPVDDAAIWRYLDLRKFRDLIASEELYFRRADLFTDKTEGLPPEQYAMRVLGLDPYDIHDRVSLNNHLGSLRESYYISCWYLTGRTRSTCGSNTATMALQSARVMDSSRQRWTGCSMRRIWAW